MALPTASDNPFPKLIVRESADDGSDFSNPAADYRVLFVGEDGDLHLMDSAGTVTDFPAGGGGGSSAFVGARVYHNAAQSIADNSLVAVAFNGEDEDSDAFHDTATNNSRLTVPAGLGGMYMAFAGIEWASNNTGYREIGFRVNGTDHHMLDRKPATQGIAHREGRSALLRLDDADYIEVVVRQTSTGSLNIAASHGSSTSLSQCEFRIARISD